MGNPYIHFVIYKRNSEVIIYNEVVNNIVCIWIILIPIFNFMFLEYWALGQGQEHMMVI